MPAKTKRAAATARALEEDSKLSKAQWKKLDLTTLKLKCNAYSLAEGTRKQMADALYDNFHKKPSDDETPPPDSPPTCRVSVSGFLYGGAWRPPLRHPLTPVERGGQEGP